MVIMPSGRGTVILPSPGHPSVSGGGGGAMPPIAEYCMLATLAFAVLALGSILLSAIFDFDTDRATGLFFALACVALLVGIASSIFS